MRILLFLCSLTILSSCSHTSSTADSKELRRNKTAWSECSGNETCVLVPAECSQPRAINSKHIEAYKDYISGISNTLMCSSFVTQAWDSWIVAKCEQGTCTPRKVHALPKSSKLSEDLTQKINRLYNEASKSESASDWMTCILRLQELHSLVENIKDSKAIFLTCKQMLMSAVKPTLKRTD